MAGLFDIRGHLVFYRKYHFNHTNVAIHLFCIPLILLSAICLSKKTFSDSWPYVTVGTTLAFVYGLYYIALDWQVGIPAFLFLTVFSYAQRHLYLNLDEHTLILKSAFIQGAIAVHIVSWLAQFYGHAVHERRAPALLDNLLQAVVLAPFFVCYEIAFWMGYKLDVKKDMDDRAGKLVKEMIDNDKSKKKRQ